jgi:type I restriction enzyme, S subunit
MSEPYKKTILGDIPLSWNVLAIRDMADIFDNLRVPLSSETRSTMKGIFPYCGANGIVDYINDYRFDGEYILIAEDGGNFYDFQSRPIAYMMKGKFWVNNHAHVLKARNNLNKFLFYSLEYKDITQYIIGSTRTKLNRGVLELIPVIQPPVKEAQKIAEILSTVDEKIDVINAQIAKTEELKKGLMQQLLTKGIGHTVFKTTRIGELPECWEVRPIGMVGQIITGNTPPPSIKEYYTLSEDGFLWASPADLGHAKHVETTNKKLTVAGFEQTRKLTARSILVTCIGSTIGKIGMSNQAMSTNQQINSVICNNQNNADFYYYVLQNKADYIKSLAGTHAVPLLNKTDFSNMLVVNPPLDEQRKIGAILSAIDERVETYQGKRKLYYSMKKGLMQQLLTGKIRVNDLIKEEVPA